MPGWDPAGEAPAAAARRRPRRRRLEEPVEPGLDLRVQGDEAALGGGDPAHPPLPDLGGHLAQVVARPPPG